MKDFGITYQKPKEEDNEALFHRFAQPPDNVNNIFGRFADATFTNANDMKSTSEYIFLASGGTITWKSKKQTVTVLSSTESEYVALAEAGHEALWLRNLYSKLGFPQMAPTIIKGDNDGSVILTHNPQFHQRSKHIAIRHHWIRELISNKILDIQSCR
jgi:hypothetical protein